MMRRIGEFIENLKVMHRVVVWAAEFVVFALAPLAAFLLRFDFNPPPAYLRHLLYAVPVWLAVKGVVFRIIIPDRCSWRYVSVCDLLRVALANLAGSALGCAAILWLTPKGVPRSIYLLDLILCFLGTAGLRVFVRIVSEAGTSGRRDSAGKRTLIYGAGDAGVTVLREVQNNPRLLYRVRGFLDDRPHKRGARILGVPVLGGGDDAKSVVKRHDIETILIAVPSATGAQMTRILGLCQAAEVECKTVPGLGDVIEGHGMARQLREVAVEDLLGRKPVRLEEVQIRDSLEGKVILVTGAAGSIGSELCRQIARFNPASIVGFDSAESPLFQIEHEMCQSFQTTTFHAEIGSIQNRTRLHDVLERHRPSVIYHAAAYKHVPMMEAHIFEAIENNVLGTYNVAVAAAQHGVEDFVMVSSDKAVRPTSIMGVTKRVSELLLLELQNGQTKYVVVRFGNVLGSSGSVVPTMKKQIARGGPVTVTHPEMRRFFMTIPEACQLVLQAAAIGKGGQICVLDMGEPVKIVDLARSLILLSGLRPGIDIKMEFTGIRPGEKLYEELTTMLEDTLPTTHEKIRIFMGNVMPQGDMLTYLNQLRDICKTRNGGRLVVALKEIVPDYTPSSHLLKRVIQDAPLATSATLHR